MEQLKNIKELLYIVNAKENVNNICFKNIGEEIMKIDNKNIRSAIMNAVFYGLISTNISNENISDLIIGLIKSDNFNIHNTKKANIKGTVLEYSGSGKKGFNCINISTPSSIVACSLGAKIIKKGSSSTSSVTGSADFLSEIGMKFEVDYDFQNKLIEETGFTFVNIEEVIPFFNNSYSGFFFSPHILSYALPATITSIRGNKIIYGFANKHIEQSVEVISNIRDDSITVFNSSTDNIHCIDELTYSHINCIARKFNNKIELQTLKMNSNVQLEYTGSSNSIENIKAVIDVLNGRGKREHQEIIKLNAAFLLLESNIVESISEGIEKSAIALKKSIAIDKIEEILEVLGCDKKRLYSFL